MAMEEERSPKILQFEDTLPILEDHATGDNGLFSACRSIGLILARMISERLKLEDHLLTLQLKLKDNLLALHHSWAHQSSLQKLRVTSPDVKFSAAPSSKGGIDIKIGSDSIHVPKYFSAQHPLVQMLLFAEMKWDQFHCPKSLAPKIIVSMFEESRSSDSPSVYEAGWISARPQAQAPNAGAALRNALQGMFSPAECVAGNDQPSLPVLFDMFTKKETSSTVSVTQPTGDDVFFIDSGAGVRDLKTKPTTEGLVDCGIDSSNTPNEQLIVNVPGDDQSNNPHSYGTSAVTSLEETTLVSMVHELGESELKHRSEPDTVAAEHATVKAEDPKATATWVIATAAPHHATGNRDLITGFVPQGNDLFVHTADGTPMKVLGCGNVITDAVVLPDVWYVPGLTANLVSVSQLSELDQSVGFGRVACYVRSVADGIIVGEARAGEGGLFEVDFLKVQLGM